MKNYQKILFLILIGFFSTSKMYAQLSYGVKAGLSLGWMTSLDMYGEQKKPFIGYHAGGILNYAIANKWGLEAAVEFQNKGSINDSSFIGGTITRKFNLIFIHIPVNFQYQSRSIYVGVGPYVGFGINGKFKKEGGPTIIKRDDILGNSTTDKVAPLDFGLNFGAGYKLSNGLRFGVVYGYSLADATPKDIQVSGGDPVKHILLAISAGYVFGGNK